MPGKEHRGAGNHGRNTPVLIVTNTKLAFDVQLP
jgi:hypothetical protein